MLAVFHHLANKYNNVTLIQIQQIILTVARTRWPSEVTLKSTQTGASPS